MYKLTRLCFMALLCASVVTSCVKKDPPGPGPDPVGSGPVKLEFKNMVGTSSLSLNNQWYLNEHGDSFKVSKFSYYISNIKLNGTKGTYTELESYHLLQQSESSSQST